MNKPLWKPWHETLTLRDEVKSGELSLAMFAADLYDVVRATAPPIYGDPKEFFATTYATENLRKLARDVTQRLAGTSPRAVRQLAQTYGGGKTHAMIALYHLASAPADLRPEPPAMEQIRQFSGLAEFSRARIAVLPFDKIDPEKGMETPSGTSGEPARWLRHPWSILAYQLHGEAGLRLIHAEGSAAERESAPAENLLSPLLAAPQSEGLATLILIDEVLMYARAMIDLDKTKSWGIQFINFFQYLTQAAVKTPRCAVVASLLANDPRRNDAEGRRFAQDLAKVFLRESEEDITPVEKEDVAEVLRRRFFTPVSLGRDQKANVLAALEGIKSWDDQTQNEGGGAEDRYGKSFPFHPDLTDVFYLKWTNIETFQRTRGVLRFFALALRDAAAWGDPCPLVGPNVFLNAPNAPGVSPAAQELTDVAARANVEGVQANWAGILERELGTARDIQEKHSLTKNREVEQAVIAVFLHSQPEGQKASLRDLLLLVSATRPHKIDLRNALQRWTEQSWFLDEREVATAKTLPGGEKGLPEFWRLGFRPNLNQLFAQKRDNIRMEAIDADLDVRLRADRRLAQGAGIELERSYKLPKEPVPDDGEFQFVILGPEAASEQGKPSKEALRFLTQKASGAPRVHKNMVVLAVPSVEKWGTVQDLMRSWKAWQEVEKTVNQSELNREQRDKLEDNLKGAEQRVSEAIRKAYTVAVAYTKSGEPEAVTIKDDGNTLFSSVKAVPSLNIRETLITPESLLDEDNPDYYVWQAGATARPVKHLMDAFTQQPRLPKMLNRRSLLETILAGCEKGVYALRWRAPNGETDTIWRDRPGDGPLADPSLEAVLPEAAVLTRLLPELLKPGELRELWPDTKRLRVSDLRHYFRGGHEVKGESEGNYTPTLIIPQVEAAALEDTIRKAVSLGYIGLISGSAAYYKEDIPPGQVTDEAILTVAPDPLHPEALLPKALPIAWAGQTETTAEALWNALTTQLGEPVAWSVFRKGMMDATISRRLQTTPSSLPVENAQPSQAPRIRLTELGSPGEAPSLSAPGLGFPAQHTATTELDSGQIMELADRVSELLSAAAGYGLKFQLTVELGRDEAPGQETLDKINEILSGIVPGFSL